VETVGDDALDGGADGIGSAASRTAGGEKLTDHSHHATPNRGSASLTGPGRAGAATLGV
jgi:hypothetical protein